MLNFCIPLQSCIINERKMVTGRTSERILKFGVAHAYFFRRTNIPVKVNHFSQVISNLLAELRLCDLSEETPCDACVFGNLNHHALPMRFCAMVRFFCNQIFLRDKCRESRPLLEMITGVACVESCILVEHHVWNTTSFRMGVCDARAFSQRQI